MHIFILQLSNKHLNLSHHGTACLQPVPFWQSPSLYSNLCNYVNTLLHFVLIGLQTSGKCKIESADTSDRKFNSHKVNTIGTNLEITRCAENSKA